MNFIVKLADFSWQKVFLIGLVLAAGYYAFMFDDGTALDQQLTGRKADLSREQELLESTRKKMKELEKFKEELNNQQTQVQEVLSFLPKQMNIGELLSTLQGRANQAGLRVLKTDPKDQLTKVEFYEATRLEIQLEGSYSQIATFLSLISKLPRLVTIDKIELVSDPKNGQESTKIQFTATLVGYRYAEDLKAEGQQGVPNAK